MQTDVTSENIQRYLSRVAQSGVLGKSIRRSTLLEHLLMAEFRGEGDQLKAYSIGLDVFERDPSFDPSSDSIVRVEMSRLRAAMKAFEASEFADSEIRVEIPIGTYRPTIQRRNSESVDSRDRSMLRRGPGLALLLSAAVLIVVFFWTTGSDQKADRIGYPVSILVDEFPGVEDLGRVAAMALRQNLAKNQSFTVVRSAEGADTRSPTDFVVSGLVASDATGHLVSVELKRSHDGSIVWSGSLNVTDSNEIGTSVATAFGTELRIRVFSAFRERLSGLNVDELTPEELFVLSTWVPGGAVNSLAWAEQRIALMERAIELRPGFGAAHSVLAEKLSYLSGFYPRFDTTEQNERMVFHTRRALESSAMNADALFNIGLSQWHRGLTGRSKLTMLRVLEIDDGHDLARFMGLVIPYTCEVPPWSVLQAAVEFDARLSADNPARWFTLSWIGTLHSHRREYVQALAMLEKAVLIFEAPHTFLRQAMILNELGEPQIAREVLDRQKDNWPELDLDHYVDTTLPRMCAEQPDPESLIAPYKSLVGLIQ